MTRKLCLVLGVLSVCFSTNSIHSQKNKVLVIEKGEEFVLGKKNLIAGKLIVKGDFRVSEKNDCHVQLSELVIDGGTFRVGTTKEAYHKNLTITIAKGINVKNGGSIRVHGSTKNNSNLRDYGTMDSLGPNTADTNIKFMAGNENPASFYAENAGELTISGAAFIGLGSSNNPAVHIVGTTLKSNFLRNCVFQKSGGIDLQLDNTAMVIENNLFLSYNGTSVHCSGSRYGANNIFRDNTIHNHSDKDIFAVVFNNPYQTFINNKVFVNGKASGIGFLSRSYVGPGKKMTKNTDFVFDGNSVINYSHTDKTATKIGVLIEDFSDMKIWKTSRNSINGFDIGAKLKKNNLLISDYRFINNVIGCIPGAAYIQDSSFEFIKKEPKVNSQALLISSAYGKAAPKINGVKIKNYSTGIHFKGKISSDNYFETIDFENTNTLSFEKLHKESIINDKDGSLIHKKDGQEAAHHHQMGHAMPHGHHGPAKTTKGYLLYTKESFLFTANSTPIHTGHDSIYSTTQANIGSLTISTGFGLSDPVHEHDGQLNTISLYHPFKANRLTKRKPANRHRFLLAANETYELELGKEEMQFYDIGLEWEAASNKPILIKVPYQHNSVAAIRSFGSLIPSSDNLHALHQKNISSYFWNQEEQMVYLKLVPQKNLEELVVYSPSVLTEIKVGHGKVPVSIRTDVNKNTIVFNYQVPNGLPSKLELLDYYGNTVETLFEGYSQPKNEVYIDLKKYDVKNSVFRYALTVDEKVHRGPIHAY